MLWRREPRFRKVVRPEEPVERVYCDVFTHRPEEARGEESRCRSRKGWFPRLAGALAVPHRGSKWHLVDDELCVSGATYLLYPSTLRPGTCVDDRGAAGIAYTCKHPDLFIAGEKGGQGYNWVYKMKGRYFRLRDDVEEVERYEDRFGHPIYIVRNKLGETFRMAGSYAWLYEILKRRGGWVKGTDLLYEYGKEVKRFVEDTRELRETRSEEELDRLKDEILETFFETLNRIYGLMRKLLYGRVEELPPPGTIPADLERLLVKMESYEGFFEIYSLVYVVERVIKPGDDEGDVFVNMLFSHAVLALGLLVYEALIVEMGLE
jgi:hypothetical protein